MSAVDTCASRSPLRAAHACASVVTASTSAARAASVVGLERLVEERVERVLALDRAAAADATRVEGDEVEPVAQRGRHASTRSPRRNATARRARPAGVEHERADAVARVAGPLPDHRQVDGRRRGRRRVERHASACRTGTRRSHACQAIGLRVRLGGASPTAAARPASTSATSRASTRRQPRARVRTSRIAPGCLTRCAELSSVASRPSERATTPEGGRRCALRSPRPAAPARTDDPGRARSRAPAMPRTARASRRPPRSHTRPERVGEVDDRAADRVAVAVTTEVGDERRRDLDRVEREVLQRDERRRAGAEVVDDEPHTDLVQLTQRLRRSPRGRGAASPR